MKTPRLATHNFTSAATDLAEQTTCSAYLVLVYTSGTPHDDQQLPQQTTRCPPEETRRLSRKATQLGAMLSHTA